MALKKVNRIKRTLSASKAFAALVLAFAITTPSFAQNQQDSASKTDMLKQRIERSKTNANHQLLSSLNGEWTFKGRHIPADTTSKPTETFGTVTKKGIWEKPSRYFITETTSGKKIPMPWSDWKEMTYHDMYIEGYDNGKEKFFFILVANHWNTGYLIAEGTYDSAAKAITYKFELTPEPGKTINVVRVMKFIDLDRYRVDSVSSIDGKEVQRSEENYTRVKKNR